MISSFPSCFNILGWEHVRISLWYWEFPCFCSHMLMKCRITACKWQIWMVCTTWQSLRINLAFRFFVSCYADRILFFTVRMVSHSSIDVIFIFFQIAVHAIGDRANDLILDMFKFVASKNGIRDRRFRVNSTALSLRSSSIDSQVSLCLTYSGTFFLPNKFSEVLLIMTAMRLCRLNMLSIWLLGQWLDLVNKKLLLQFRYIFWYPLILDCLRTFGANWYMPVCYKGLSCCTLLFLHY